MMVLQLRFCLNTNNLFITVSSSVVASSFWNEGKWAESLKGIDYVLPSALKGQEGGGALDSCPFRQTGGRSLMRITSEYICSWVRVCSDKSTNSREWGITNA